MVLRFRGFDSALRFDLEEKPEYSYLLNDQKKESIKEDLMCQF